MTLYEDIKEALLSRHIITFAAAVEAVFTGDRGEIYTMNIQLEGDKMSRWARKMLEGADTKQEISDRIAMGALRSNMGS